VTNLNFNLLKSFTKQRLLGYLPASLEDNEETEALRLNGYIYFEDSLNKWIITEKGIDYIESNFSIVTQD
jgi:hypothetical protein